MSRAKTPRPIVDPTRPDPRDLYPPWDRWSEAKRNRLQDDICLLLGQPVPAGHLHWSTFCLTDALCGMGWWRPKLSACLQPLTDATPLYRSVAELVRLGRVSRNSEDLIVLETPCDSLRRANPRESETPDSPGGGGGADRADHADGDGTRDDQPDPTNRTKRPYFEGQCPKCGKETLARRRLGVGCTSCRHIVSRVTEAEQSR